MFEIYAYGNVDTLTGVFNAIAAIMGGADYFGLIKAIAITGVLVAAFAGLFTPGKFHGWGWLMGFLLVYYALFLPKVDVVIVDKLGSQPPVAVGNVPIGVAFFGHATSKVGDVMTRFFETAFQVIPATNAQLPGELAYQKNGVMFGNRLIQASRAANVADPQLRTDLIAFVHNCTVYDLQDGTIDPAAFAQQHRHLVADGHAQPGALHHLRQPGAGRHLPERLHLPRRPPAGRSGARAIDPRLPAEPHAGAGRRPHGHRRADRAGLLQDEDRHRGPGRRGPAAPEHHDQPGAGHDAASPARSSTTRLRS